MPKTNLHGLRGMALDKFAGLCTLLDPTNVPSFMSPACQDVQYFPSMVQTRQGLRKIFDAGDLGSTNLNGIKMFVDPQTNKRVMLFTSDGKLWQDFPAGTLTQVIDAAADYAGLAGKTLYNSATSFGREYMAFSDGKFGINVQQAWNGQFADQVSQDGPGEAPIASDDLLSYDIVASPGGVFGGAFRAGILAGTGLTQVGNLVTLTLTAATVPAVKVGDTIQVVSGSAYDGAWQIAAILNTTQIQYIMPTTGLAPAGGGYVDWNLIEVVTTAANTFDVGQSVVLAGVTVTGAGIDYNGTYEMRGRITSTTILLYLATAYTALPDASGDGTISLGGAGTVGKHKLTVMFYTRNGYTTRPAPPNSFVSGGDHSFKVENIPLALGLVNVLGRVLAFTGADGDSFYTLPRFTIADNTTTSLDVDFSDLELLSGTNVDYLFDLVQLHEPAGVLAYTSRLIWWGERNALDNLYGMSFDGGWSSTRPLGWTRDSVTGAGTLRVASPIWGAALAIIGDGVTPARGLLTQGAYKDYLGDPIIEAGTSYSIRARVKWVDNTLAAGTLNLDLFSALGAIDTTGLQVTHLQVDSVFREYTAVLTDPLVTVPSDLILRVFADGTVTNTTGFIVDNIEIFPTKQPYNVTQARASRVDEPDSYNGVDGFLSVAPENGQAVRSGGILRDYLYFVKESSLYVTQNDPNSEPADWPVHEVSPHVGTPSIRGVGFGEEWWVIASRQGLYYFDGSAIGDDQKLSQEIQPTWDSINWSAGETLDVKVDLKRKQIYIAAPFGVETKPSKMLVLDITEGFGNALSNGGVGRKWCPWLIPTSAMNIILLNDGTEELRLGNTNFSGDVYALDNAQKSDDGAAIDSYYEPGFFQDTVRLDFGYLEANISGVGVALLELVKGRPESRRELRGWSLLASPRSNQERQIRCIEQRASVRFETNYTDHWFSLQGMTMWVEQAPWSPIRGVNAR